MPAQRGASAFQISVGTDKSWRVVMTLLGGAAGAALLASLISQAGLAFPAPPVVAWLLAGALLLPGMAWYGWRCSQQAPRTLRWDGQAWWLDDRPVRPRVVVDLGSWMLLRLSGGEWLPSCLALSRTSFAPHWSHLRATLYSAHVAEGDEP